MTNNHDARTQRLIDAGRAVLHDVSIEAAAEMEEAITELAEAVAAFDPSSKQFKLANLRAQHSEAGDRRDAEWCDLLEAKITELEASDE